MNGVSKFFQLHRPVLEDHRLLVATLRGIVPTVSGAEAEAVYNNNFEKIVLADGRPNAFRLMVVCAMLPKYN